MVQEIESPSGAHMVIDGQQILNFGGSCYLGLSQQPELIEAGTHALRTLGPIAQLGRHYGFALTANLEAEKAAQRFFEAEAAMYFATGYLFGLIAMAGLKDDYDIIFIDEKAHYSLRDGAMASGKPLVDFKHCSPEDLSLQVKRHLSHGQVPLLATDGMFATIGNLPPLDAYFRVLEPFQGWLVVDESHSFGVIGAHGRGAVEKFGLSRERVVAGGSLGKALCAFGGIAIGSEHAISAMWKSAPARGAGLGMSSGAAMSAASMTYLCQHPEQLETLRQNIKYLKAGLRDLGIQVDDTEAPIATFSKGTAAEMDALQQKLMAEGIHITYSKYIGAGPDGCIRLAIFSDHRIEDIDRLLDAFRKHMVH